MTTWIAEVNDTCEVMLSGSVLYRINLVLPVSYPVEGDP